QQTGTSRATRGRHHPEARRGSAGPGLHACICPSATFHTRTDRHEPSTPRRHRYARICRQNHGPGVTGNRRRTRARGREPVRAATHLQRQYLACWPGKIESRRVTEARPGRPGLAFNLRAIGPEPSGATPLEPEDLEGLIPDFVATRADLNIVEFEN